jgi:cellulose synthase (UDP-forming)
MSPIGTTLASGGWLGIVVAAIVVAVLPWLRRESSAARTLVVAVSIGLGWRYMLWRVTETLPPADFTLDFIVGAVFAVIEALALLSTSLSFFFLTRTLDRTPEVEANMSWLMDKPVKPQVDVLICTYNEDESILEQTIVGALAMDYPNFRVWVCDDARRAWLEELCTRFGCGYITRTSNEHAKAGNINNALAHLSRLPEPPEFVSILDADFVPTPQFLTRAMTLFHDDKVGIVQTPQHFINPDPIGGNLSTARVWPDEQRYFFDVLMASKDAWGAAFCCGTSSILRFSALMKIGGFPTDSVTEDYLVTLRLRSIGYQTVYLNERLSLGLAPEGLKEYVTQRSRWCLGFVQICRGKSSPWRLSSKLTLADRVILSATFLYWSAAHAFRLTGIWIPILYLLVGIEAVNANVEDTLSYFVPYFLAQMAIMGWVTQGRVLPIMTDVCQLLAANEVLRAVAAGLFKPKGQKFKVTAKGGDRSQLVVQWPLLRTFLIYLVLTVAGVVMAFVFDQGRSLQESSSLALFWSWYNIVLLTIACMVCIEQPRMRKAERFNSSEQVVVVVDGTVHSHPVLDISRSGLRLAGTGPAPAGSAVEVRLGDASIAGRIARVGECDFAVQVDDTLAARTAMIKQIYSGRYSAAVEQIRGRDVFAAVVARFFR